MFSWFVAATEALLLIPLAVVASWAARTGIRALTRRAVRRAPRAHRTSWRVRLDRLSDDGQSDTRKRQRADAVARMLGHLVTVVIVAVTGIVGLNLLGVDAVFAISSAGFVGFAIAISAQDVVKDFLAGIRVLLEDRYAVGDVVVLVVGGNEVRGTIDLIGAASVRLRTPEGTAWHAGHHVIESVTNESQLPTVTDISIPVTEWAEADPDAAADRLVESSNDVGLTGVVFVRDIETHGEAIDGSVPADVVAADVVAAQVTPAHIATTQVAPTGDSAAEVTPGDVVPAGAVPAEADPDEFRGARTDTVTVSVKSNRPLSRPQTDLVRDRLLGH